MKLHTTNISLRNNRRISSPILRLTRYNCFILRLAVKRVHEVTARSNRDSFKQRMRPPLVNSIPPNLRHDLIAIELTHASLEQTQATRRSKLLRFFKQQLHTNTNTEHRPPSHRAPAHEPIKTPLCQRFHARGECADTRQ